MNLPTLITVSVGLAVGSAIGLAGYTGSIDLQMLGLSQPVTASTSTTDEANGDAIENADEASAAKNSESESVPVERETDPDVLAIIAKAEAYFKKHPQDRKKTIVLGGALIEKGEFEQAIGFYKRRLATRPEDADFLYGLGWAYEKSKQWSDAAAAYEQACQADSQHIAALNNLSWVLSTAPDESLRNGERAVKLAKKAMRHAGSRAQFIEDTLAAAYAESGDFENAIKFQKRVVDQASSDRRSELRGRLKLYEQGQPYRSN